MNRFTNYFCVENLLIFLYTFNERFKAKKTEYNIMNIKHIALFALFSILFFSCKDEIDNVKPIISIQTPTQNSSIDVVDTIHISGMITDDEEIVSIQINIVDDNNVSQSTSITINPNSDTYELNENFVISNQYLVSGKYYLLVKASDGSNETKSFTSLYISEIPKVKEGLIIFSHTDENSTNVYKLSDSLGSELILSIQDAIADATISSHNKQIYFTGKTNESISAYEFENGTSVWQKEDIYNAITDIYKGTTKMFDNYAFVSQNKSSIIGIDNDGTVRKTLYISDENLSPVKFFKFNDLVAITAQGVGGINKFATANYTSGAALTSIYSNFDVQNIIDRNNEILYLIGQKEDTLLIKSYSIYYDMIDEIISLPETNYHSSVKIGTNIAYIIANNSLYKFNFIYSSLTEVLSGIDATKIIFDEINSEIIMYSANTIYTYDFPELNLIKQVSFAETIDKIEILYNK
ncbi:MAG: hypothetical protein A2W98_13490 [Bacteroidetes bacterium GWF2_33_38]|nr:MAG: hypothetical protein A2W98_13490 [Bacteroidetes bacterium GWF2_33_38]OFY91031.1 MAG: hypothetical protein A2236_09025 [Bacteroidetes bacterium RIFOXYA2_FULL_33_7]